MIRIYSVEEEDCPFLIHSSTSRSQKLRSVLFGSEIENFRPLLGGRIFRGGSMKAFFWGVEFSREVNVGHRKRTSKDLKKNAKLKKKINKIRAKQGILNADKSQKRTETSNKKKKGIMTNQVKKRRWNQNCSSLKLQSN